jgi:hypothetical protein
MDGVTPALPAQPRLIEAIHDLLAAAVKSTSCLNIVILFINMRIQTSKKYQILEELCSVT